MGHVDVRVDEKAVPHSHPVLTLSTRFMVRTADGVMADYLHEQLHWFIAGIGARPVSPTGVAQVVWRVPRKSGGGAKTRRSTRLHLTVNWLEYEALAAVIGRERALETIQAKAGGPVYPWVYRRVLEDHEHIAAVLRAVGLATALTLPGG